MMKICPRCNQRFGWKREMGPDYIHQCNSKIAVLDTESILQVGDWDDYTGSGTVANPMLQGRGSKASGKMTSIENIDTLNIHGKKNALYRRRQHLEYIPIEVK